MTNTDILKKAVAEEIPHLKYIMESLHGDGLSSGTLPETIKRLEYLINDERYDQSFIRQV